MKKLKVNVKNEILKAVVATGIFELKTDSSFLVLGGGAVRAFITDEIPNDLDVFLINDRDNSLKNKVLAFLDERYKRIFTCPDGFLYSFQTEFGKLQLITPTIYSSVEDLLGTFDLSPSLAAFDGEYVYTEKVFIKSVKNKVCQLLNMSYPLATMNRIYKYKSYGYLVHPAQTEFITMLYSGELDLTDAELYRRYID